MMQIFLKFLSPTIETAETRVCPSPVGDINSPELLTWTTGLGCRSNSRRAVIKETGFLENDRGAGKRCPSLTRELPR